MVIHGSIRTKARLLLLVLVFIIVITAHFCCAFNLDVAPEHVNVVKGPAGSHFGFKVQAYMNTRNETMLVVSAPKLNNLVEDPDRPGRSTLIRGHGGLLVCHQKEQKCNRQFFFETKKPLIHKENRTNQNFGWSLQIGDGATPNSPEVPLIACAPMWRFRHNNVSEMTGACFLSRIDRGSDSILVDNPNTTPFYPCLYRDSGNCQSSWSPVGSGQENPMREHCTCIDGYSAVLVKGSFGNNNGRRPKPGVFVLGAPGGTYWAGGAYAAPLHGAWMVNNDAIPEFKAIAAGPKEKRDNNSFEFDNGLFGYAMAYYSVDLPDNRRQQLQGVAISGIKTKALGEVVLASMSLARNEASINYFKNNSVVRGTQLSEAFGFALACGDINGDGLPEIFVGAPFFFTNATGLPTGSSNGNGNMPNGRARSYDSGRVYIFSTFLEESDVYADYGPPYNLVFHDPAKIVTLDGLEPEARFGSAIDFLGDINDDGFGDVVIAAPFGGKNNLGAVYIFLGSVNGIGTNAKPSQVIEASQFSQFKFTNQPITTPGKLRSPMFGYTVQGRYDVDGNDYPDLIIGAFGADTVVVIRSRPVAKLSAKVAVNPSIIGTSINGIITSPCKGDVDSSMYLCAELLYCFGYTGKSLPPSIEVAMVIDADVTLTTAATVLAGRAFFDNDKTSLFTKLTMRSSGNEKTCGTERVRVLRAPSDLLTPIIFQVTLATLPPPESDSNQLVPIFMTGETFIQNTTAEIAKDCGPDNICIPDFRIDIDRSRFRNFILGDTRPFLLNFTIRNDGEEAYGGKVTVLAPDGALFNGREVFEVLFDGETNKLNLPDFFCTVMAPVVEPSEQASMTTSPPNHALPQTIVCDLPQPFRPGRTIEIRMSFSMSLLKMADENSPETRFTLTVTSINPELNSSLWDNRAQLGVRIKPDLSLDLELVPSPEQIVYEENEYSSPAHSLSGTIFETAVGPHLYLEMYVFNKGPTSALRIDVNAKWPQDPFRNHSLLYLVETPYLLRGRGRCYAGPTINPLKLELVPQDHRLARPRTTPPSTLPTTWNDADPTSLHCYVLNISAGDYARIVLRTRLIARNINMLFASERSMIVSANARVVKLPTTSVIPTDVSVDARVRIEVVTRMADFSLAHVDLWIIAVALGAGLLTVVLVLLSLWLAGCFDRKVRRPKANYVKLATFEPIKTQAKRVPVVGN